MLLAFLVNDHESFRSSTVAAYLISIDGLNVHIGVNNTQTGVWFNQNKRRTNRRQVQVEVGVIINGLRGSHWSLNSSRWIPMYGLHMARQTHLRFLNRVCGINDEVYILLIFLPVKIENFAVIDHDVRFNKTR